MIKETTPESNGSHKQRAELLQLAQYMRSNAESEAYDAIFNQSIDDYQSEFQSGYHAGTHSRYLPIPKGVRTSGTNADYHYAQEYSYFLMMERARADDRDNMVIGQGINRLVANVFQTGFNFDPETGDAKIDADLKAEFDDVANDPEQVDYEGEKTLSKMREMAFRSRVVDGDMIFIPTDEGTLQHFEGHHLRNPYGRSNTQSHGSRNELTGIVNGVQLQNGRRVGYHVTPQVLGAFQSVRFDSHFVPARDPETGARNVYHIYDPKRFSQRRGVTTMAPLTFVNRYHDDAQFATLVNLKRQSFYAILKEWDSNAPEGPDGKGLQGGARRTATRSDGSTQVFQGGGPGQDIEGQRGQKVKGFAPNIPPVQFFKYAELLLSIMAVNIDVPLMLFMLDVTKGNFNNYRGVMQQAQQRFRIFQRDSIHQLDAPFYGHWLRRKLGRDPILRNASRRSGIQIGRHRFTPEGWPYIQPVQDAAADALRRNENLTSDRRASGERGADWPTISREIVEDRSLLIRQAIEAARDLNNEFADVNPQVNWREIAFRNSNSVRVNFSSNLDETNGTGNENDDED